jgi:NAD+ kinase
MLRYSHIGLTVKRTLDHKDGAVERVLNILKPLGAKIYVDSDRMKEVHCLHGLPPLKDCQQMDLMLVIGGDGTILRAVRELNNCAVPILSVNRGAVGFLAETNIDEADEVLPKLLAGEGAGAARRSHIF